MRYLFNCLIISALMTLTLGCGHSGAQADSYTETIYWEDMPYAATDNPEEISDSQLLASDETESAPDSSTSSIEEEPEVDVVAGKSDVDTISSAPLIAENTRKAGMPLKFSAPLHEVFNDSNHFQLHHARRLGIEPMTDIGTYFNTRRPLVKIETNKDFVVDELHHSYPYLVPEAAALLHDIGRSFQDSLAARQGGKYRIIVTSVLRTPVTVRRLRRVNRNATQESTHQYATTFDITYTRFNAAEGRDINTQEELKNLLGEVLYDLRDQGRCLVKYERKSPCYHITVVK